MSIKGKYRQTLGNYGEKMALEFLQKNNYLFVEKNFKFSKCGEVDIIAWDNDSLCFIEVKTRSSIRFGRPSESVTYKKQKKIRNLAQIFINNNDLHLKKIRFDIVEVLVEKTFLKVDLNYVIKNINLIKNAF